VLTPDNGTWVLGILNQDYQLTICDADVAGTHSKSKIKCAAEMANLNQKLEAHRGCVDRTPHRKSERRQRPAIYGGVDERAA
jgi:hypothetical protein